MVQQIILNGITIEDFETRLIAKLKTELSTNAPVPVKEQTEDFLTVKQTANLLGVSATTLHAWKKAKKIKFHRFGTRIRFKKSEILNAEKFSTGLK